MQGFVRREQLRIYTDLDGSGPRRRGVPGLAPKRGGRGGEVLRGQAGLVGHVLIQAMNIGFYYKEHENVKKPTGCVNCIVNMAFSGSWLLVNLSILLQWSYTTCI